MNSTPRVVYDCNIFLQALIRPEGPSGRCVSLALRGEVALFISPLVVDDVPTVWTYERDPDDAHFVNLALAADAQLVVSRDRDLLDLMDDQRSASRDFQTRFPSFRVLDPVQFLSELTNPS